MRNVNLKASFTNSKFIFEILKKSKEKSPDLKNQFDRGLQIRRRDSIKNISRQYDIFGSAAVSVIHKWKEIASMSTLAISRRRKKASAYGMTKITSIDDKAHPDIPEVNIGTNI